MNTVTIEAIESRSSSYVGTARPDADVRFVPAESERTYDLLFLEPCCILLSLLSSVWFMGQHLSSPYISLGLTACVLFSLFGNTSLTRRQPWGAASPSRGLRVLCQWGVVIGILLFVGLAADASSDYSRKVLVLWSCVAPLTLLGAQFLRDRLSIWVPGEAVNDVPRHVIVGANRAGFEVASRMPKDGFMGFFDFRGPERLAATTMLQPGMLRGHCDKLADFVRKNAIDTVYVALPMTNAPRIAQMLESLRDTTANIVFVPDIFDFDLIRARVVDLNGIPGFAICDTPHRGTNAAMKRMMDVVLASCVLVLTSPLLIGIALAIKLSSPGPVLFKQRRYGLNGDEIHIYKFRSMTVCEDGALVTQATKGDMRVTSLGRLLRRTSLDELPQLFNVLEGTMSCIGPRPHAIAHNELYRKVINGYMIRHKVLPGLTGWAQVNGLRGETDTLDKMQARVEHDLDYVNNWTLALDLRILLRTVKVLAGPSAY